MSTRKDQQANCKKYQVLLEMARSLGATCELDEGTQDGGELFHGTKREYIIESHTFKRADTFDMSTSLDVALQLLLE